MQTEEDILRTALDTFSKTTGLTVEMEIEPDLGEHRPDAVICIVFQDTGFQFAVQVKKWLTHATIGTATQRLGKYAHKGLLVTRYVTPQMAENLKELDVPFMDMAGNAYVKVPQLFIHITGEKLPDEHRPKPQTRAFQPTGLKVIFALLCKQHLVEATFREIAKTADVALGTVGWVVRDLRRAGHIIDLGKHRRRLTQKDRLLERWVTAYPEQLRPKLLLGNYTAQIKNWWERTKLTNQDTYWGGEIAAAKLTKYLRPQVTTVYTGQPIEDFLQKYKLRKDPHGQTEILNTFWHFNFDWPHTDLVHPIIIYADLLATGDPRNIETAKIIYDQELVRLIQED